LTRLNESWLVQKAAISLESRVNKPRGELTWEKCEEFCNMPETFVDEGYT